MYRRQIALLAVLLAVTACGGNPSDTTTEQSANTTAAEQRTPTSTVAESESETTPTGDEGGDNGVETAAVDACALLTEDEVAAVIGGPADIDNEALGFDAACYWETVDEDGTYAQVSVELGDLGEFAQEEYQNWTELVTIVEESVSLGDEAFLGLYGVSGSQLVVRDGTLLVFVSTTEEGHEETIKTYGSLVLDRLG